MKEGFMEFIYAWIIMGIFGTISLVFNLSWWTLIPVTILPPTLYFISEYAKRGRSDE